MFACYRKDEVHDPELYCAAVAAVLSEYPAAIAQRVADPRTGIASRQKFLPSVAEIKECCEAEMARVDRLSRYEQLPKFQPYQPPIVKREPGTSYEEMFAKHGRPIGRFEKPGDKWNPGIGQSGAE